MTTLDRGWEIVMKTLDPFEVQCPRLRRAANTGFDSFGIPWLPYVGRILGRLSLSTYGLDLLEILTSVHQILRRFSVVVVAAI